MAYRFSVDLLIFFQAIIKDPFMLNSVILVFANKQDMVCIISNLLLFMEIYARLTYLTTKSMFYWYVSAKTLKLSQALALF